MDGWKDSKEKIRLLRNVWEAKTLKNLRKLKGRITSFGKYVEDYLGKNPSTDIRKSSLTIYYEKIISLYHEKEKEILSRFFTKMIILGTFLMVVLTGINIICQLKTAVP